jgi:hypothetical protein
MEITKESFLKAEDSKNRDAMLFDMLSGIADKIDDCNKINEKVDKCKNDIMVIKGVFFILAAFFTGLGSWFGLK